MSPPVASADRAGLDLTRARAMAARLVDSGTLPCILFGVVDPEGRTATGMASRPGLVVDARSIFFLGSITKGIVATAVMRYVDEGRLDVSAPLRRYLPAFDGAGREGITAWHVLTHTSGLPDLSVERLRRERPTYRQALDSVLRSTPAWAPGTRYEYNSAAWLLLSETMARLSSLPFPVALAQRLTGPLGMEDTTFDPRGQRSRLVPVQGFGITNRVVQEVLLRFLTRAQMPGGGLFGTLPDLLRLGRALLPASQHEPGPRVLSGSAIAEMGRVQTEGLSTVDADGISHEVRQALGWRLPQPGWPGSPRAFTHGGISGGRLWVDPEAGFAFAFLTNLWQAPLEPAIEVLGAVYESRPGG